MGVAAVAGGGARGTWQRRLANPPKYGPQPADVEQN
jgi:hypothetical protein